MNAVVLNHHLLSVDEELGKLLKDVLGTCSAPSKKNESAPFLVYNKQKSGPPESSSSCNC